MLINDFPIFTLSTCFCKMAELGKYYTLEEFRKEQLPDGPHSLIFRLENKPIDCDLGDLNVSKMRPVKIQVVDQNVKRWAASDGKLQLFCASELKRWVNTKVPNYQRLQSTSPFDRRQIVGVQYLTQAEIDAEVAKYDVEEDEVSMLTIQLVKLKDEELKIINDIKELKRAYAVKHQQVSTASRALAQLKNSKFMNDLILRYDHLLEDDDEDARLYSPLFAAIDFDNYKAVQSLLRYGADINEIDTEFEMNALHFAAQRTDFLPVFDLILSKIRDVNAVTGGTRDTALMLAAETHVNPLPKVKSLLRRVDINLNAQDYWNGYTALMKAIMEPNKAVVKELLKDTRLDLTLTTKHGWTALDFAKNKGPEFAELFPSYENAREDTTSAYNFKF